MKFGSVCSGIEAASVAWHPLGWETSWVSEIEKFPCKVLAHHYPAVENRGDMTRFKEWSDEPIELLVGGTPCQSFSIAGLRKGLDDPRGNLMLTFGAIAGRYRPKWLVWENVPGVLSSNGGRDFGSFLGMLGQLGYGFAYRVLDAQFFGVAQRRRRVFVVGHLGDWRPAAAVLFERHSLSGHPAPSREKGERVTPTVASGPPFGRTGNERVEAEAMVVQGFETGPSGGRFTDLAPTLDCRAKNGPMQNQLGMGVAMALNAKSTGRYDPSVETMVPALLTMRDGKEGGGKDPLIQTDRSATLATGNNQTLFQPIGWSEELTASVDLAGTIQRGGEGGRHDGVMTPGMAVRRLTPRECERLQGFPDDYTLLPGNKADGPRYKALGNSMAVPVMRWIGERIQTVEKEVLL